MLSKRFAVLATIQPTDQVTLRRLEEIFGDDGAPLVIVLLCLPFLSPIPLPGISTVFGFAIIAFTVRIFKRGRLYLPGFIERATIKGETIHTIGEKSLKIVLRLEKVMKPRAGIVFNKLGRVCIAMSMLSSALALALPIPPVVPFSNFLPAAAIGLFAVSLLMRDGFVALAAHLTHLITWAYIASVAGVAFSVSTELYKRYHHLLPW